MHTATDARVKFLLMPCEKILKSPYQLRILDEDIYH